MGVQCGDELCSASLARSGSFTFTFLLLHWMHPPWDFLWWRLLRERVAAASLSVMGQTGCIDSQMPREYVLNQLLDDRINGRSANIPLVHHYAVTI